MANETDMVFEVGKITGNVKKGYFVAYYEWQLGCGSDCGLNRKAGPFTTRAEARAYKDELKSRSA